MDSKNKSHSIDKAVIYCRVSDVKQTTRGTGLESQETRCREYARFRGYEVVHVYKDEMSGGLINRPGIQSMLMFLRRQPPDSFVVIIDDISRIARDIRAHLDLREAIAGSGARLESPSIEFGEDSDSILVENLLASMSQHQRQKNAEQTRNRMRSRILNGYWPFHAPVGYRYEVTASRGKIIVPNEPLASIVRQALEGYATERYSTQAEVKRYLESEYDFPKSSGRYVTNQRVNDILRNPLYAGYINVARWGVNLQPANHEPLISFETYQRIQDRLSGIARVPARADINEDFPLRGFILCGDCGKPLTANWSKGKSASYPYYLCRQRGCVSAGKSVRREVVEGRFEELLKSLQPSPELFDLASSLFKDLWDHRADTMKSKSKTYKAELSQIDRKIEQLMERLVETDSDTVIKAYERKIAKLESDKALLRERINNCGKPLNTYEESFEHSMAFLSNPWNLWETGDIAYRQTVLKLAFSDQLAYSRDEGFRTPQISLPFKALGDVCSGNLKMAHSTGFEPVTFAFGAI